MAVGVLVALALFGAWFWKAWTVWWFDAAEAGHRQSEAAARLRLPVEQAVNLGGGVKLELVLVPAGRFRMGSPANEAGRSDDEMLHWVVITRPFYMGKYEVTQEVWEKVMGTNPSAYKGAKNPVGAVSWDDCQQFLKRLNVLPRPQSLSRGERGRGEGLFRLPTEAEWEWACRAGTRTRFCSGNDDAGLSDYAWCDGNPGDRPYPVGEKKPNAWGLFDMHGNACEWCHDWYEDDSYAKSARYDPTGPATGSFRVLRGGSRLGDPRRCRSANRINDAPTLHSDSLGFRVVVVPAGH